MTLSKFFLGAQSVVDISTDKTIEEILLMLSSRFDRKHNGRVSSEQSAYNSKYVYQIKGNSLTLFFAKGLDRKSSVMYPALTAELTDDGTSRSLKGYIGIPEYIYYLFLIFFILFAIIFFGQLRNSEQTLLDNEGLYGIVILPLMLLIESFRTRKKVIEMKREVEEMFKTSERVSNAV